MGASRRLALLALFATAFAGRSALAETTVGIELDGGGATITAPNDEAGEPTLLHGSAFTGPAFRAAATADTTVVGPLSLGGSLGFGRYAMNGHAERDGLRRELDLRLSALELMVRAHVGARITHSHLDHVDSIAFELDSVGALRPKPVTVYATGPTAEILKKNLFNWDIWPDFTVIPTPEAPFMRYREIEVGSMIELGGRRITVLPAVHTVPAVGYLLDSGKSSLVFSGDTGPNDALWEIVNRTENLKYLIIETAFSDKDRRLAYRGQFDDSRPGNGEPATGRDLRAAIDAVLAGRPVAAQQTTSIGCNIKWKPGNEPDYFA